ncbi:MAG TPA: transmembrane 220 family protein [Kofleriaceae bacterium]
MRPVPRWFVAICWMLAVVFAMSAGLQINDPDPLRWMLIYGAAAIAIGVLPARRYLSLAAIAIGLFAAGWAAYLGQQVFTVIDVSDLWMKMSDKGGAVEVGREAGGLAIVALGLLGCGAFRATRV